MTGFCSVDGPVSVVFLAVLRGSDPVCWHQVDAKNQIPAQGWHHFDARVKTEKITMRDPSDDGKSAVNFFAQNLLRDGKFAVKFRARRGFPRTAERYKSTLDPRPCMVLCHRENEVVMS